MHFPPTTDFNNLRFVFRLIYARQIKFRWSTIFYEQFRAFPQIDLLFIEIFLAPRLSPNTKRKHKKMERVMSNYLKIYKNINLKHLWWTRVKRKGRTNTETVRHMAQRTIWFDLVHSFVLRNTKCGIYLFLGWPIGFFRRNTDIYSFSSISQWRFGTIYICLSVCYAKRLLNMCLFISITWLMI